MWLEFISTVRPLNLKKSNECNTFSVIVYVTIWLKFSLIVIALLL